MLTDMEKASPERRLLYAKLIYFRAQQGGDPAEVLTTVDKWLELIYKG